MILPDIQNHPVRRRCDHHIGASADHSQHTIQQTALPKKFKIHKHHDQIHNRHEQQLKKSLSRIGRVCHALRQTSFPKKKVNNLYSTKKQIQQCNRAHTGDSSNRLMSSHHLFFTGYLIHARSTDQTVNAKSPKCRHDYHNKNGPYIQNLFQPMNNNSTKHRIRLPQQQSGCQQNRESRCQPQSHLRNCFILL